MTAALSPQISLNRDSDLQTMRYIHDERGGPRAVYAWAIGRSMMPNAFGDFEFFTADLDTNAVEDFSAKFYTAYNARFGLTY